MSASQEVIPAQKAPSLVAKFADRYGVEANKLVHTLKATCFKGDVSNEQLMALLIVADQHGLNPWTKEIHAFDDRRGGIVPVVGVDGWARIVNEHPAFDGMDFEQDDEKCTCRMYRKDRSHPIVVTEYMAECKRGGAGPWQTHPKRMLRHKTMIQCARIAFSFAGIYDSDEAERIIEAQAVDVTGDLIQVRRPYTPDDHEFSLQVPEGTQPQKISAKKLREIVDGLIKSSENEDCPGLYAVWGPLTSEQKLFIWGELRSWERAAIKKLLATPAYKVAESGLDIAAWSISALREAKDPEALDKTYAIVEEIYADHDQEVPLDIQTIRSDRRAELGVSQ
jgi:phage recombination protein Bet